MGRPKDEIWNYVDRSPKRDGFSCRFCRKEFKGGASRIKGHLSGLGKDIGSCEGQVPFRVRRFAEVAFRKMEGGRNEFRCSSMDIEMVMATATTTNTYSDAMAASSQLQPPTTSMSMAMTMAMAMDMTIATAAITTTTTAAATTTNTYSDAVATCSQLQPPTVSMSMAMDLDVSYLANNIPPITTERSEKLEDLFVRFIMDADVSLEVINNHSFQRLWRTNAQLGVQSIDLFGNSNIIHKSLMNFEQKVNQWKEMIIESCKIIGCSIMIYDVRGIHKVFLPGRLRVSVVGLYCPEGLFFEGCMLNMATSLQGVEVSLLRHDSKDYKCQYVGNDAVEDELSGRLEDKCIFSGSSYCLTQEIQTFFLRVRDSSVWSKKLIEESEHIFNFAEQYDGDIKWCKTVEQWREEQLRAGKCDNWYAHLEVILDVENKVKSWASDPDLDNGRRLSYRFPDREDEFWHDLHIIWKALNPLFEILNMIDTLVPTAGYMWEAMEKAKCTLESYRQPHSAYLEEIIAIYQDLFPSLHSYKIAAYLNPKYLLSLQDEKICELVSDEYYIERCPPGIKLISYIERFFKREEWEAVREEMKTYQIKSLNPFAKIEKSETEKTHPVMLWYRYGDQLPLLKKCAIKILSQPSCCFSHLVGKHLYQFERLDNSILRLNARMMEEFNRLGDDIYKSIDLSILDKYILIDEQSELTGK